MICYNKAVGNNKSEIITCKVEETRVMTDTYCHSTAVVACHHQSAR